MIKEINENTNSHVTLQETKPLNESPKKNKRLDITRKLELMKMENNYGSLKWME